MSEISNDQLTSPSKRQRSLVTTTNNGLNTSSSSSSSETTVSPQPLVKSLNGPQGQSASQLSAALSGRARNGSEIEMLCVDMHAGGEPARVVVAGFPHVPGSTMYDKRVYCMENLDHLRKLLLLEPRGYPCQNANVILPPTLPEADIGVVIMEQNKIYPLMSGHNMICVVTAILEMGLFPITEPVTRLKLETPGGIVPVRARCSKGKVLEVTLTSLPSFVEALDVVIDVPHVGKVKLDIAFGGMWYAVVNAASVGLELKPENGKKICQIGELIKTACREQRPVNHPLFHYPGVDILVFRGPASQGSGAHAKNAVVMSNNALDFNRPETWTGMIDRSPCGTGTCAVMATMWARGELNLQEDFIHESIVGATFTGRLITQTNIAAPDTTTTNTQTTTTTTTTTTAPATTTSPSLSPTTTTSTSTATSSSSSSSSNLESSSSTAPAASSAASRTASSSSNNNNNNSSSGGGGGDSSSTGSTGSTTGSRTGSTGSDDAASVVALVEGKMKGKPAVVPEITGRAWVVQLSHVFLSEGDPFPRGYTVGDIW